MFVELVYSQETVSGKGRGEGQEGGGGGGWLGLSVCVQPHMGPAYDGHCRDIGL